MRKDSVQNWSKLGTFQCKLSAEMQCSMENRKKTTNKQKKTPTNQNNPTYVSVIWGGRRRGLDQNGGKIKSYRIFQVHVYHKGSWLWAFFHG